MGSKAVDGLELHAEVDLVKDQLSTETRQRHSTTDEVRRKPCVKGTEDIAGYLCMTAGRQRQTYWPPSDELVACIGAVLPVHKLSNGHSQVWRGLGHWLRASDSRHDRPELRSASRISQRHHCPTLAGRDPGPACRNRIEHAHDEPMQLALGLPFGRGDGQ
jgi:hypothetical protein